MGLRPFGRGVNGYAPHRRFGGAAALRAQAFLDKELEAKMAVRAATRAQAAEGQAREDLRKAAALLQPLFPEMFREAGEAADWVDDTGPCVDDEDHKS